MQVDLQTARSRKHSILTPQTYSELISEKTQNRMPIATLVLFAPTSEMRKEFILEVVSRSEFGGPQAVAESPKTMLEARQR